ncbi:flippase [Natronolimnohabitans sp. A-GB9]|uniref:flippase n=1 Tax=Natronolimnohabitans sp. A-GB9 TaxID=3069757 RepID=UPI0027AF1B89|nr:flippase [Natronolimnohabitans sp. A-GB9]MDQ2052697.1 flippase [Natronolimnohabitans sp. A-GB9]
MVTTSQIGNRFRWELAAQVGQAVSTAILLVILARLLDPDSYGLLYLTISYIAIAEVFSSLGMKNSSARYIAEYKEEDCTQVPYIIQISFLVILFLALIVSMGLIAGRHYIAELAGEPNLAPFLLIGSLYLVFTTVHEYTRKLVQGFEAIELSAQIKLVAGLTKPIFAVGFVILGYGALGAYVGYVVSVFLGTIVGILVLYFRFYRNFKPGPIMEPGLKRRLVEYSIPLTGTQAAGRIDNQLDTVLVGFFLTPMAVSYYVVSKQIVTFIERPASALGFTLGPTAAAESTAGNTGSLSRIYENALTNIFLLYVPAAAGLTLVAEPMIELLFGTEYLGAVPVLQILSIYAVLLSINLVISTALDYLGRARIRAILKGITSIMNVGLNIILIPQLGVIGAAIATVITYSLYALGNTYIVYNEINLRLKVILIDIIQIFSITMVMAISVFSILDFITGWISMILVVGIGVTIYATLSVAIGLVDVKEVTTALT